MIGPVHLTETIGSLAARLGAEAKASGVLQLFALMVAADGTYSYCTADSTAQNASQASSFGAATGSHLFRLIEEGRR